MKTLLSLILLAAASLSAVEPVTPQQRAAAYLASLQARQAQIEVLRLSLLSEMAKLSPGEQALYQPAIDGVRRMLQRGDVIEARKIIFLSPVATQSLADARLRMLAEFTRLFPSLFPQP